MAHLPAVDPDARDVIVALRATGASYSSIATLLNRLGVKGFHGGRWYGATVQRVIRGYAMSAVHGTCPTSDSEVSMT